jgi:hypothetical protein
MKLFLLKSILLASVMFICVLFGMQQANEGIHQMKGYSDQDFGSAFTVKENKEGNIEATFLGEDVSSHDLEKKKQELREMNSYNFFSSVGKSIADGVSQAVEKMIRAIANQIGT